MKSSLKSTHRPKRVNSQIPCSKARIKQFKKAGLQWQIEFSFSGCVSSYLLSFSALDTAFTTFRRFGTRFWISSAKCLTKGLVICFSSRAQNQLYVSFLVQTDINEIASMSGPSTFLDNDPLLPFFCDTTLPSNSTEPPRRLKKINFFYFIGSKSFSLKFFYLGLVTLFHLTLIHSNEDVYLEYTGAQLSWQSIGLLI